MDYSPDRRTALVLCGTGVHGAYHAGVLRACREAGIRIDVVAGHGIGAGTAALAAIDGGSMLWDDKGLWRGTGTDRFYRWHPALVVAGWFTVALAAVVASPLLFLLAGLVIYPVGFGLSMLGLSMGAWLVSAYGALLATLFSGENLPTIIPRAGMFAGAGIALSLLAGALLAGRRAPVRREGRVRWWWELAGAPLAAAPVRRRFADLLWQLIRGADDPKVPEPALVGRRYGEVLSESLGQPGVRELLVVATDLDARQDVVGALLREPYRGAFFASHPGRERQGDAIDLAAGGADRLLDLIGAGLTPGIGADPLLVRFAPDSFWKGEAHRLCDRPGALLRLLTELKASGVEQVVMVSAVPPVQGPHRLAPADVSIAGRLGDAVVAGEAATFADAEPVARRLFATVHAVRPVHNPLGPFDMRGVWDPGSHRWAEPAELLTAGYEDARRQFIDPVVGASGEHLATSNGETYGEGVRDTSDSWG